MSVKEEQRWITGAEYGRERRRLLAAQVPQDAPEFQRLIARVVERDNYLYERFGKPYLETHYGKWIGISVDGQVIIRDSSSELIWDASEAFGAGNYSHRKLAEFPGYDVLS